MLFFTFGKYVNFCLFFCYYFEILFYLLFKFSYKYIKIISYMNFELCNPTNLSLRIEFGLIIF